MHYKNGREAKLGDRVLVGGPHPYVGVVVEAQAGADTCNLRIVPCPLRILEYATAKECLHVDDVGLITPAPAA